MGMKRRKFKQRRLSPEERDEAIERINGNSENCTWALTLADDECEGLAWLEKKLIYYAEREWHPYCTLARLAIEGLRRSVEYQHLCHETLHKFEHEVILLRLSIPDDDDSDERLPN